MRDEESLIKLGNIEGKVDSLHAMVKTKLDDHEGRIRKAETKLNRAGGAWGVLMGAGLLGTLYKYFSS